MAGIRIGTTEVKKIMVGTTPIKKVMRGQTLIWQNASISASPNPVSENYFMPEPAPASRNVSASTTLSGAELTSATWAKVSGGAVAITSSGDGLFATFSASVPKNTSVSAIYRATGNHGLTVDVPVELSYTTDL